MAGPPLVIIGAPRSGTNMLRDLVCSAHGVATWPCDEINYIWRHGNASYPSDAFTADMATPKVRGYIRRKFQRLGDRHAADTVVEKTCANSLRVDFVARVLDDAKYIFIYRNGMDAVASAMSRWRAKLDFRYLFDKARFVPLTDLPYYSLRYVANRVSRLASKDRQLAFWGPVLPDMDALKAKYDLAELCALQWQACVESSEQSFERIPADRMLRVRYEDLVQDKEAQVARIERFIGLPGNELIDAPYFARISPGSIGKSNAQMSAEAVAKVHEMIAPTIERLGYQ